MNDVVRLYVEKRPGFDVEAQHLLQDLKEHLGLGGLAQVRLFNRYDIVGLQGAALEQARSIIFSEPNQDTVYNEALPPMPDAHVFAMEFLPGQYDQRADSAMQCVQFITMGERPQIACARVIALFGAISDADIQRVQAYCINPIESRLAAMDKPDTLTLSLGTPEDIPTIEGFIAMNEKALADYWRSMGFAMTCADLAHCQAYFRDRERRDPTETELKAIDTYWSDHCRHTTFLTHLDDIKVHTQQSPHSAAAAIEAALHRYLEIRREVYGEAAEVRPITLMDMATIGAKAMKKRGQLTDLDESKEINACSIHATIEVDGKPEPWLIQFKNETHNHPTEIEPFGGAATCLGGAIRDPLSGRAYVYQAMRVTGSGDPRTPLDQTLPGKLAQRRITTGAAAGYSAYGNQIGLATGLVNELYDEGYVAKRMEIGAVVGACPRENVVREDPQPGDVVVLLGGRTGRDGCGGATGSSKAHTQDSIETCGAEVQKGSPPTERKIQRLFRNPEISRLIKRCNDFGAGGVSVAIGELAPGLCIDLDSIPKKYEGLSGTELAISESQERMAVVLAPQDVEAFLHGATQENLEATVVAVVTEQPRLVMRWRGKTIVDIERAFLDTNGVEQHARAELYLLNHQPDYRMQPPAALSGLPLEQAWKENLSRLEVCQQKGLSERFDASIGAATVLMPFGGKHQLTPEEAMVAKVPVLSGETDDATAMAYGFVPGHARQSPFHASAFAVVESLSRLAAVGAPALSARLTLQEYFERLGEDPKRWGKPAAALLGALEAQMALGVPAIGGKDSMSGSFEELDVPPTLVCFAIAMTRASRTVSAAFKKAGSRVVLLPIPLEGDTRLPDWERLRTLYERVYALCSEGNILAASVVREGGVAAALTRMALGNCIGLDLTSGMDETLLFAPQSGALVLELGEGTEIADVDAVPLGTTKQEEAITLGSLSLPLPALEKAYAAPLEGVFPILPSPAAAPPMEVEGTLYTVRSTQKGPRIAKPRVLIPVFPGTNCEVDTARAFERAGAYAELFILNNLSPQRVEESLMELARRVENAQIVMLPGGFSGGDEPSGSGKFIATALRNPRVADAITQLLEQRDGLMLGICNGFQALIKLGLLPTGKITSIQPDAPTLTFNTIGRHISRLVNTRITSINSPWMAGVQAGDVHTVAISHGEGRFVASPEMLKALFENGQVATQYVDDHAQPTADARFNPNGSFSAIEGIFSPDGRVFGKMGHSERTGKDIFINVPGNQDQKLFASGVAYFG